MPIILTKVTTNRETTTHPSKAAVAVKAENPVETIGEATPKIDAAAEQIIKDAVIKKEKK